MKKQEETMLQIGNTLVSLNVVEKKFCCNLAACKGICCVEGDSGAPLTDEETGIIEDEYENICDYMRPEGRKAVDEQGTWVIDTDNDKVTPLINKNECAFVIFEEGITKCAIEKAWADGKTIFRKPISCHLYPIRLKEYADFIAVNYDEWEICKPALANGEAQGLYVYQFLREPLIRRFGEKWYKELMLAADSLLNMQF